MAGAASAHQASTASREQSSQQRAGRTRRTSADHQRAQQGATAAAVDAPAALDSLSRLQQLAYASPQVAQLRRLQALADGRFPPVAQLAGGPEEEELVQGKFAAAQLQPQLQQAPRANNTGLPDQLKSGIESLSGLSMDHVRVHYNSAQPAQLNALAYAQGSDIHLASGQERHLPHEAWHVVQQAQGRVRPTMQMKDGVQVNDDAGLEREADVMGTKALEQEYRADETHRSISLPIEAPQLIEGDTTNCLDVKVANNDSVPLANGRDSAQRGGNEMQRIADQRPEAALQRQAHAWGDGSERVGQLRMWQAVMDGKRVGGKSQALTLGFAQSIDGSVHQAVQRKKQSSPASTIQREAVAQLRGVPEIKVDIDELKATVNGLGNLPYMPSAATILEHEATIIKHYKRHGLLDVEIKKEEKAHGRTVDTEVAINARLAQIPGELANAAADVTEGTKPAPPQPAGGAWGDGKAAYIRWQGKNSKVAENRQKILDLNAESASKTADIPIAQLVDARNALDAKLAALKANLARAKQQRYEYDLITTVTPVCKTFAYEGKSEHGESTLGVFVWTMPPILNGIERCIDPFEVHAHYQFGSKKIRKAHFRNGRSADYNVYSGTAKTPKEIPGWQGMMMSLCNKSIQ